MVPGIQEDPCSALTTVFNTEFVIFLMRCASLLLCLAYSFDDDFAQAFDFVLNLDFISAPPRTTPPLSKGYPDASAPVQVARVEP